ncbi:MAG: alpha-glucan family phosphorylase [Pseudomonadales bacterium]|nr:alpha-glucan family phosphorylase [Pseudomonadales bacterium]
MTGTRFSIEVQPKIPAELSRIEELANNLIYSWDRQVRGLFFRLDRELWDETNHNPKLFLRRIDQVKLEGAAKDPVYMQDYQRVLTIFDSYLQGVVHPGIEEFVNQKDQLVSYSCAEFGLHESFPIYSGGLGILAGDHCKAASDMGLPFVAVGMLYRQGYFNQRIDAHGNQIVVYSPSQFSDLPIKPVLDQTGEQMQIALEIPGRQISLRIWVAHVGHIKLYLMDSDIACNSEDDRRITYQLYGGDSTNRLLQEMVLGIGGVRVKRALGLRPTVWHINEGHAAFQIIERCRELVQQGHTFDTAIQAVASNTVFTTHTPVPAGHDIFDHDLIRHYFSEYVHDLNISMDEFIALGDSPANAHGFNMTALALRGSRFHNGVSRIHGGVASDMERYIWPDIPPEENPIRYVTNGVHVPTFLASEWANHFDLAFGGRWRFELLNKDYWQQIYDIPNHSFWSLRKSLKTKMLETVYEKAVYQYRRDGFSESQIRRMTKYLNPRLTDVLTIGFARRFATYKRATLIFSDIDRLRKLLTDEEHPVVLIFAGKAHPHDQPGQDLIRRIWQFSLMPEFQGKIILLENFDVALARKLVTGVDVWLNNPAFPLEASGTSGQKAGINGVLNLSVLDGWWDEGYNGENGWSITPHGEQYSPEFRDHEEAKELLDVLETEVIPLYYERDGQGYSAGWIDRCKNAMASLIPQFNAQRMLHDYVNDFYIHAANLGRLLQEEENQNAKAVALWKAKVLEVWPQVSIERLDEPVNQIFRDQAFEVRLAIDLGGLEPDDVAVDLLMGRVLSEGDFDRHRCASLHFVEKLPDGKALFRISMALAESGKQSYMIRVYPYHPHLGQRFEMGCMKWL